LPAVASELGKRRNLLAGVKSRIMRVWVPKKDHEPEERQRLSSKTRLSRESGDACAVQSSDHV
jgi:hypothetical protein